MSNRYIVPKPISWYLWSVRLMAWTLDKVPFSTMTKKPTVAEICERAEKEIGLSDYGDHTLWKESLEAFFDDLYEDKDSNHTFRMICRDIATERVIRRLKLLNAFKEYPEALELELPKPFFVVGLPRTGSTFLHQCNYIYQLN